MRPVYILAYLLIYFFFISLITWLTTRNADNLSFYLGNKKSPWALVAFGMIGTSISGVTFISVTGQVAVSGFSYLVFVAGLLLGYQVIAFVLLPLYYRLNLTSIYTYLELRFGPWSHRTGSLYFLIARTLGAAARLYLVVEVLNDLVFKSMHIPFEVTVALIMLLIFLYTVKGGIKTIVYTDTIQTTVMVLAVLVCIWEVCHALQKSLPEVYSLASNAGYTSILQGGSGGAAPNAVSALWKSFFAGIFICIGMTGLDQDLMQKNLSIKNIGDAQKNMVTFSFIALLVNLLFLILGAFIAYFMKIKGISVSKPDLAFGEVATRHFTALGAVIFVIGLIAISFASADSAITALTTSFCIDILNFKPNDPTRAARRRWVHFGFSLLSFLLIIFLFKNSKGAVINSVYAIGSYTYGPLIALYAFGLFIKRKISDRYVPFIAIVSALVIIGASLYAGWVNLKNSAGGLPGFDFLTVLGKGFGNEVIIYNALLTFAGLLAFSEKDYAFNSI